MLGALWRLIVVNLLGNLLRLLANVLRAPRAARRPRWVALTIRAPLPARPPRGGWLVSRRGPSLAAIARLAEQLAEDPRLVGVVVRLGSLDGGWARAHGVREVLATLRQKGKRVVVHLSSPSLREYWVACAGDAVLCDESGPLAFMGLAAEALFFAGALEKVGARAEAEYRGAYKSFAETFTRRDMSPAHREALEAILDGLEAEVRDAVAAARRLAPQEALERLRGGPYLAADAERLGLVDAVRYFDEVASWLGEPGGHLATPLEWARARLLPLRLWPLFRRPRRVRVLALHGPIVPGEGAEFPRRALGADAAARAIDAARRDRGVAAVVLHVDSRGGSAAGSDRIWREVVRLGREKPVVAYLDDVAASGGYYLACGATRIVCQPTTLTGSIGVVAGKLNLAGLYERLGLGSVVLSRGDAAAMHSPSRGFSEEERRRLALEVDALYRQFVRKVAEGRRLSPEAAEAAAKGRVWLGRDAHARGLVDEMGGVERALELARELGRRRPGERLVVEDARPAPRRANLLVRLLGEGAPALPEPVGFLADLALFGRERALCVWPDLLL